MEKQNHPKGGWYNNLLDICKYVNVEENLTSASVINVKEAESKLLEKYKLEWKLDIGTKSKLQNYAELKQDWCVPSFLAINLPKYKRSLLHKLFLGVLPLEIEVGRYVGLTRENRTCKWCQVETECELHFLFRCSALRSARVELYQQLPDLLSTDSDLNKWKKLLTNRIFLVIMCPIYGTYGPQCVITPNKGVGEFL